MINNDTWFEEFSRQYFEEEYDRYYLFDHNKQLHALKNMKITRIEGNILDGYVQHGKYKHNHITIEFKPFNDDEKNKLLKVVSDSAVNKFKIINKIVPPALYNCGVDIFPESLEDLSIECSFDDDENNLIDILSILKLFNHRLSKNKLLIFKIRGLDLIRSCESTTCPVKNIDEILNLNFKSDDDEAILTDLYEANLVLLQNSGNPTNNYKFIYEDLFKQLITEIESFPKKFNPNKPYVNYDTGNIEEIRSKQSKNEYFKEKWAVGDKIIIDIGDEYNITNFGKSAVENNLFVFLNELHQVDIDDADDRILFLDELMDLTYTLVKHNAVMPQVFRAEEEYHIRWIPSFYDSNVVNYCKKYYSRCPEDLVTRNGQKISEDNQVIIIISIIMNDLIKYTVRKNQIKSFEKISNVVFRLFTGGSLDAKKNKRGTIDSISKQLSIFYLKELEYSYVMSMDESYNIEIKVEENGVTRTMEEADEDELNNVVKIYDLFSYYKISNVLFERICLSNNDFLNFNRNIKDLLKYVNVELRIPFDIIDSKIDLVLDIDVGREKLVLDKIKYYYRWKIGLTGTLISFNDFDEVTDDMNGLIKIGDKVYVVDGVSFRYIKSERYLLRHKLESNTVLRCAILRDFNGLEVKLSDNFKNFIESSKIYDEPVSLKGTLRAYQKIGYSWLIQNIKSGFGSILADDMGLGKTVQVLATILYFKENSPYELNPTLIVVPPTLISNWEQEIRKFTPDLSYKIYHGYNRTFLIDGYDIVLTSYGIVREDCALFLDQDWFIVIIDEAQNIKNPSTKVTQAVKSLPAFNRIALTGTPIENRLTDYWSIFDFIITGYLSSLKEFKANYVVPIEKSDNKMVLDNLKTIAKPFVLRRLKTDEEIRDELPEKIVNDIYCSLTKKQVTLYNKLLNGIFDEIEESIGITRKANILKLITCLKQTCNHPGQYYKTDKVTIKESGKMELLINLLENILAIDEKVIVFTQYVRMGEIIQKLVSEKFKCDVLFLHGSLSQKERTSILDLFQEDPDYKILVATLKTGGVGLNLTAASNVIHYDLWWNPAVENQATDRVHRIGQENDVMVYRFITKGTLEEEIDQMSKNKIDLADMSISTDETFITELSNEELRRIMELRL